MDIKKPKSLRELIEQCYAFPALFPEKNDFLLSELGRQYRESIKSGKVQQKKIGRAHV